MWWHSSIDIQNPKIWWYHSVALNMSANLEDSAVATALEKSSFQFPRRAVLKNVQTVGELHSFPMLVRSCLKFWMLDFSITQTKNFQTFKLCLEKAEEPEIKLWSTGSQRKQGNSRKKDLPLFHQLHYRL